MRRFLSLAALAALTLTLPALGQPKLKSPVVHPDNTVTFNYYDTNAKSVSVDVQFAGAHEMTKGADGVWSITLGPAAPDIYPYCFKVDGISVMDPLNGEFFPNETFKNSLLDIPGSGAPLVHAFQDVPHGAMDYVKYWSNTLGIYANAIIYTPPFYNDNPDRKYPVMVLISGTTDTEEVYYKVGKMNLILDNLIAQGAAKEMILVLPYGNPSKYFDGQAPASVQFGDAVGKDLVEDLLPFVDANYRTIPDRHHRGIGGFSRGGNQGLSIGLTNLDKFSWLCSYSSFTSTTLPGVYDDPARLNSLIHLFWSGVGTDDFLYGNAKEYTDFLDSKGINVLKVYTHDKFGHTWMNAKYFLDQTFRLLFQEKEIQYPAPEPAAKRQANKSAAKTNALPSGKDQKLTPEVMARLFPAGVVSPEFGANGSVTFRFRAENASKVELESDLTDAPVAMRKDWSGVWSVTLTAPRPDLYQYCFVVDGTRVADPQNMYLSPGRFFKKSLADVRAARPGVQDVRDVPQGKVTYRFVGKDQICIYTPAGYNPKGAERLPVLYLLQKDEDTFESWFKVGRTHNILNNLIAGNLAERMIAVMACGSKDNIGGIRKFINAEYDTSNQEYVDDFALGDDNWLVRRDHLENVAATIFKTEGRPMITNINANGYPKLMDDNSVVFKFRGSADASPVIDLCGKRYEMLRDPDDFWTCRTEPQVPGYHYYNLIVNGISTADPASQSYYGCSRMSSAIEIPEAGCELFEPRDVPHGQVREMQYFSKYTNSWRPILVYTPASYEKGNRKYPVVYIHHGGGEDHRGWIEQGRTATIMDNLIAEGRAAEMIVVSVNSNVPAAPGVRGGYSWEGMQPYREELLDNIIPFVEKTFRVKAGARNRAMCGLSMGGGQSFYIGLRSPGTFANVGMFSTGIFGGINGSSNFDLEANIPGILSDTGSFNAGLDNFFISCGEQDPRINYTKAIVEKMKAAGVDVKFNSYPGDHEWQVWRKSFAEFATMLFN